MVAAVFIAAGAGLLGTAIRMGRRGVGPFEGSIAEFQKDVGLLREVFDRGKRGAGPQ